MLPAETSTNDDTDADSPTFDTPTGAGAITQRVTRGVVRSLTQWGWACLTEVRLTNRRRADVMALSDKGEVLIIEVKSGLPDFRADSKWPEYLPFCDHFAFAVDLDFPQDILPPTVGLLVCDGWDAEILRPWTQKPLHASRRKALTLRFARLAAFRACGSLTPEAVLFP